MTAERDSGEAIRAGLGARDLAIIGAVAFAARLAFLLVGVSHPELFRGSFLDSKLYVETAAGIRAGHGAGPHPYLLSPLYPYFLALFPSVEGSAATTPLIAARVVQSAFGVVTCVLVARIADRIASRRAGWIAGLVAAVYGPAIHFDATILVASLQGFFLTLALWLSLGKSRTRRRELGRWLACGLALGASAALRPTGLAVVAALSIALVVEGLVARRRGGVFDAARPLALLAGAALVVAPFTIRNARVSGELVLLSANGGLNFWIGNHADAFGVFQAPPDYDLNTDPVGLARARVSSGRDLTYGEASAWWRGRALDDIADDPAGWVTLVGRKVLLFLHPVEIPQVGSSYGWHASRAWPLGFPLDARWLFLFALAAPAALALTGGRRALHRIRYPLLFVGVYGAAICLFFVTGRYRAPIMPALIAVAAAGFEALRTLYFHGNWTRVGPSLALLAALIALPIGSYFLYGPDGPLGIVATSTGVEERQLGISLMDEGRYEEAIEVFQSALAERENPRTRTNLGQALRAAGRPAEAFAEYERVLAADPQNHVALFNSANLLRAELRGEGAAEALRTTLEAERLYREATQAQPTFAEAHFNLGLVLGDLSRYAEAIDEVETALELAPNADWRPQAGRALAKLRDLERSSSGD